MYLTVRLINSADIASCTCCMRLVYSMMRILITERDYLNFVQSCDISEVATHLIYLECIARFATCKHSHCQNCLLYIMYNIVTSSNGSFIHHRSHRHKIF
mgnify:CR=1 FL=1